MVTRRYACFRLRLDIALERLRENNDLIRLKRKWWEDKSECTALDERLLTGTSDLIKVSVTQSLFTATSRMQLPHGWFVNTLTALLFTLCATIILAFILAVLEFLFVGCCASRSNKVAFANRAVVNLSPAVRVHVVRASMPTHVLLQPATGLLAQRRLVHVPQRAHGHDEQHVAADGRRASAHDRVVTMKL